MRRQLKKCIKARGDFYQYRKTRKAGRLCHGLTGNFYRPFGEVYRPSPRVYRPFGQFISQRTGLIGRGNIIGHCSGLIGRRIQVFGRHSGFNDRPPGFRSTQFIGRSGQFIGQRTGLIGRRIQVSGRRSGFNDRPPGFRSTQFIGRRREFIGRSGQFIGQCTGLIGRRGNIIGRYACFIGHCKLFLC